MTTTPTPLAHRIRARARTLRERRDALESSIRKRESRIRAEQVAGRIRDLAPQVMEVAQMKRALRDTAFVHHRLNRIVIALRYWRLDELSLDRAELDALLHWTPGKDVPGKPEPAEDRRQRAADVAEGHARTVA